MGEINLFFFFNVEEVRTNTRPLLGGSGAIVPDFNRLKPPRWPSRLRSRGPGTGVNDTPRRSRRARQSGSPTGLLGDPEALMYQRLSLTSIGDRSGSSAPPRSASTASAAPSPADPFGVGVPHPHPLRCLLPKHNLLTEGGHGRPPSLAHQQCLEDRQRREAHPISTAASTPDSIPACAAPNPRSHRSDGNARSPLSWFGAGIHQSTRARWAPASPCKSGVGGRGRVAGPVQPNVPVWKDGLDNP